MTLKEYTDKLEIKINDSIQNGISLSDAERLAFEFLSAQIRVSDELANQDLEARVRKSSMKAIKKEVRTALKQEDQKLTEAAIATMIDADPEILAEQMAFDMAEVERNRLERLFNIFHNSQLTYRTVAKGS